MTTARKTYVKFVDIPSSQGAGGVEVTTLDGGSLGHIGWYNRWRQFVFVPQDDTIFSHDCLEDIAAKVTALNEAKR